ncbi:PepSY-associated TM helix domain-containing protein [Novosphingobium colocasiae]|uniref:PepSY-associated TM helix domain-containing protein n=1 Tax=Novosphingobium colocasiae TaxID=1256513 RepID=UPI0035B39E3D
MATRSAPAPSAVAPATGAGKALSRQFWVILHRWAGLSLTLFLAVAGFTGIFLSWLDELEAATAPELHLAAPPSPGARPMEVLAIRDQVLARYPGARINFVPLDVEPGRSLRLHLSWPDPKTGIEQAGPGWDDLFLDPYTGRELGRREWGDIRQGMKNLMPFVYRLHYSLALGPTAMLVFGVAALIWTLDCFVGFYLTLPVRQKPPPKGAVRPGGKTWWRRWQPSWIVRWRASGYKLNFDLHRAGGLWLWPLLMVFAWSSVSFNLPQVYVPVMKQLGAQDPREAFFSAMLPRPRPHPALDFEAALARGQVLAGEEARKAGLAMRSDGEAYLWHSPEIGAYVYGFTTSADISKHGAGTSVAFDSDTGALKAVQIPTGSNAANTFTAWIVALHTAHVLGTPWRIAVSLIGAAVTMLCITGLVIWTRKRGGRAGRSLRRSAAT